MKVEKMSMNEFEQAKIVDSSKGLVVGGGCMTAVVTGCKDGTTSGDEPEWDDIV